MQSHHGAYGLSSALPQGKPCHSRLSSPPTVSYTNQGTNKLPPSTSWLLWQAVRSLWSFQKVAPEPKRADFSLGTTLVQTMQTYLVQTVILFLLQKRHKGSFYCFTLSLPPEVMPGVSGPNPAPCAFQFTEISLRFQQLVGYLERSTVFLLFYVILTIRGPTWKGCLRDSTKHTGRDQL